MMYSHMGSYDPSLVPGVQFFPRLNPIPMPTNAETDTDADGDANANTGSSRKRALADVDDEQGPALKRTARSSDVVYRLLVPSSRIGKVIGKQGARIRELRAGSGAQIKITDPISKGEDRVIMISSKEEDIVDSCTAAEYVLARVANMIVEEVEEISVDPNIAALNQGSPNLLRLLIGRSQAGCLIGKGGYIIKEIRDQTGANVRILPPEQMPFSSCVSDTDRLVQISGELSQVQEALKMVATRLRENPPKESVNLKPSYHQQQMRYAQAVYGVQQYANGSVTNPALLGGLDYQAASMAIPPTPKVTSEMRIPSALMGGVIGRGGANITHVRVLSGCAVKVYDQEQGRTDRSITFEGTAEQVAAAQSLVQAFMSAQ